METQLGLLAPEKCDLIVSNVIGLKESTVFRQVEKCLPFLGDNATIVLVGIHNQQEQMVKLQLAKFGLVGYAGFLEGAPRNTR